MFVSSSRPTAAKLGRLAGGAFVALLLLGPLSSVASAAEASEPQAVAITTAAPEPEANPATAQVNSELAVCPGQTFSQPFEELGDSNYYTLVEGSEFAGPGEGWTFFNGAKVVTATRPDGNEGGVLDLPSGSVAISPPVCVTLQYPTARTWVEGSERGGSVKMAVLYGLGQTSLTSALAAVEVGSVGGKSPDWELSKAFKLDPQAGGKEEGVREARFVYVATGKNGSFHAWGLYVDPRFSN